MAIRLDAQADYIGRTTNLPPITTWTMMCWAYLAVVRVDYEVVLRHGNTGGSWYQYGTNGSTATLAAWNGTTETAGSVWTVNTWKHLTMACAGTGAGQFVCYQDGAVDVTLSGNSGQAAQDMRYGTNWTGSTEWLNGRLAAVKVWSAALTQNEIAEEMRSYMPVRTANLNTWSPLLSSAALENLANTGAWTVGGTLTTEDGPPIAWSLRPSTPLVWAAAAVVTPRPPVVVPQAVMRGALV